MSGPAKVSALAPLFTRTWQKPVAFGDVADVMHPRQAPGEVNRQNGLGPRRDQILDSRRVEVERFVDVAEYRRGAIE